MMSTITLSPRQRLWLARTAGTAAYGATIAAVLITASFAIGGLFSLFVHLAIIFGRLDLLRDIVRYGSHQIAHPGNPFVSPVTWTSLLVTGVILYIGDRLGTRLGNRVVNHLSPPPPSPNKEAWQ